MKKVSALVNVRPAVFFNTQRPDDFRWELYSAIFARMPRFAGSLWRDYYEDLYGEKLQRPRM